MFRRINLLKRDGLNDRVTRKRLGKYEVLGDLWVNQRNRVYIGIDSISGSYVSIKQMTLDSAIIQQFAVNQIQIIKSFNHPNLLSYLHHYQSHGFLYLITQLCQSNLFDQLKIQKTFKIEDSLRIFKEIVDGYSQMRQKGYIHRDLKPQNIFIKDKRYKIGDFGFAIKLKDTILKQKYNIGTPFYMSPEVLLGNKYSQKSDIWSLGLILYQLINGKLPFRSKSEIQLRRQILIPIRNFSANKQVNNILMKCLQVFVQKRMSLSELKMQLNKLLYDEIAHQKKKDLKYTSKQIVEYQITYIKLLQYIINLSQKSRLFFKPQRIAFIVKYQIKMKIQDLKKILNQHNLYQIQCFKKQILEKQAQYNQQLIKPQNLEEKSRFHFFNCQNYEKQQQLIWQIQGILKEQIKNILKSIKKIQKSSLTFYQNEIKLLDFMITFFALNKLQILDKRQFTQQLKLIQAILNSPTRITTQTLRNIQNRLLCMKIV